MSLKGLAANTVTYTVFIQGYFLVGKPHVAQEVFNQMGSHNVPPDIRTYNVLLDGLCYNGKVEKALMIFEYMQKREMDRALHFLSFLLINQETKLKTVLTCSHHLARDSHEM
ncbi:hypothetical protein YC2023_005741 [Brassica napus]